MMLIHRYLMLSFNLNFLLIILTIIFLSSCNKPSDTKGPNIILIMTDQQHGNMISAMGNPDIHTPAMDLLAKNGIMFSNAYCSSPVCGPARSSIITGLMPHQTGVEWNGQRISSDISNAGEIFKNAGYKTVWAGKWHLPESYPQKDSSIKSVPGFDLLPIDIPVENRWFLGSETDPPLTRSVVNYLKDYDEEQPLFLSVSYHNPHDICMYARKSGWFTPADSMLEVRYYDFDYKLPTVIGTHPSGFRKLPALPENHAIPANEPDFISEKRKNHLEYGLETMLSNKEFGDLEWQGYLHAYNRLTEQVDEEINQVLTALKEYGYWENTLIIFTSDHGDGAAAHKWAAKLSLYEESSSIPMIVYWPGIKNRGSIDDKHVVSQIDILPTMIDFSGIEYTAPMSGSSMKPIIEMDTAKWRDFMVVELADFAKDKSRKGRMLRMGNFKYNIYSTSEEQLFDLSEDPGEMQNLIGNSLFLDVRQACRNALKAWAQETNDEFANAILDAT